MNRTEFLRSALGVGVGTMFGPPLSSLPAGLTVPVPDRVGLPEIEFINTAFTTFTNWDNAFGGSQARKVVLDQLTWSAQLLRATVTERHRPELFAAVGSLAAVAGFMAFDALAHRDARHILRFAFACAEESGDWHLRAKVLSSMARQEIWCGDADQGLTYIEMALVRADRLTATERAMLSTVRARALARMDSVYIQEALAAVGRADEEFSHRKPQEDPSTIAFYDDPQHHGDTAHALSDLELGGHPTTASDRLRHAIGHHTDAFPRSRTLSLTKLAALIMATGDPLEAVAIGHQAADGAGSLRSPRSLHELRELYDRAEPHASVPAVGELRHRVRELVAR